MRKYFLLKEMSNQTSNSIMIGKFDCRASQRHFSLLEITQKTQKNPNSKSEFLEFGF